MSEDREHPLRAAKGIGCALLAVTPFWIMLLITIVILTKLF